MRLALFDLDGTILAGNSWHECFGWAVRRWPMHAPVLAAGLVLRKLRVIEGRTLRDWALRPMRGLEANEVAAIGREICAVRLTKKIRSAARAEISRVRGEGFTPVLATGAFAFLAEPLAKELGIDDVVCSRLEFANGKCLGRIAGDETRRAVKADAVRAKFSGRDVDWAASRAYSDDVEDAPLWELVGDAICVLPPGAKKPAAPARVRFLEWKND